ncbi:MAG: SH3 domain-containing protein [Sulfitobacter sp.]
MKRFILLSFAFLGWTFYEMSGGSDFDAEAIRTARLEALEVKQASKAEPAPAIVAPAPAVVVDTAPLAPTDVTRVSLNLTTLDQTDVPQAPSPQAADTPQVAELQTAALPDVADTPVPQNVSVVTSSASTPAIIPSLINPNDGVSENLTVATAVSEEDIRTVSGNRVNVRGGPGTDFGIVSKLVRGDAVKIVEDNGDGWVRLEPLDGGPSGWMADFLLVGG